MWKLACISAWTPTPYGKLACGDALSEAAAGQSILMLPKQSSTLHRHCVRCRTARFSSYEICRTLQASGLSHLVDAYNHMRMGLLPGLPNHLQELTDLCACLLCGRDFCNKHNGHEEDECEINHDTYYKNHKQLEDVYPSMTVRASILGASDRGART